MNTALPQTPFEVPVLNGSKSNASPAEFLKFLQSLVTQFLRDDLPRISAKEAETWTTIVNGLTDHFLGTFPLPDVASWNTMHEKIDMTEATLEVVKCVFLRVEGIYNGSEVLVKKLFSRLLDLYRVMDIWVESEVLCDDGAFPPVHMKEKACDVLVSILRGLGDNNTPDSGRNVPSWKIFRSILTPCLEACNEYVSSNVPSMNSTVFAFFAKPAIEELKDSKQPETEFEDNPLNIVVGPVTRIPIFLVQTLEVILKTIYPSLKCQWFLADISRKVAEFSKTLLMFCVNPICCTTNAVRRKVLMNIITITTPLRSDINYQPMLGDMLERFLLIRLEARLNIEWDSVDHFLINIFKLEKKLPVSSVLFRALSQRLFKDSNRDLQNLSLCYLRNTLPCMDSQEVTMLKDIIEMISENSERDAFLDEISQFPRLPANSEKTLSHEGRSLLAPHVWRQHVFDLVQEIIMPETLSWMDDENSSVPQLCQRTLQEIQIRFQQTSSDLSSASKQTIAEKVAKLPCLLAQCDGTQCLSQTLNNHFLSVGPYIPLVTSLLDASREDSARDIRRKTYIALGCIVRHHDGKEVVKRAIDLMFRGTSDLERSVRISAGHALSGLVQLYGLQGKEGISRAQFIFDKLYQRLEVSKDPIRETLIVTVAAMAKSNNVEILGQIVCLLVAQLGRHNPVIKGLACMHLLAISKQHHKTPYSLLLPYMEQLAPFTIKSLPTQPDLLGEACRLMAITPSDFIIITLQFTLPELFATCDHKVLDAVTKVLSTKASSLLIKHSHTILAHIFLLPNQAATSKALNFVIKILTDATSSNIDVQSVVKSCVVPLLAELVVVMGDENPDIAQQGAIALLRVENALLSGKKGGYTSNLGAFLKTYMLGLISDINDMLQDVQGKKTVATKRKILRSLGALVQQIGSTINNVSPQIMATFQTMVSIPELCDVTLESWYKFLTTLGITELGPHIGPTSAAIVSSWPVFSPSSRNTALLVLEYIVSIMGPTLQQHLAEIVDLSAIEELRPLQQQLNNLRGTPSSEEELLRILSQSTSDNITVSLQALRELKLFMLNGHKVFMHEITSGDMFDYRIGHILASLFASACRDNGDSSENLRLLAFECIGILGAMDPDRFEITYRNTSMVVMKNFLDEEEAIVFALHLIQDLLVGAFRSTSDIKYQSHLAYSIQELLKFCQFTPALVTSGGYSSVTMKIRRRWNGLPKHVLETVTPLLEARFTLNQSSSAEIQHPIYPTQSTYREWIQLWATHLITRVSGATAQRLFGVFRSAVRNKDVVVAHHLLPHLVLNILISGDEDDALSIRTEMLAVLEDQVDLESNSTSDKKLLSAQAVFVLLDHLNKWVRLVRQEISLKKADPKRTRLDRSGGVQIEEQLFRLDSILTNIDQSLMAKAAFQCKAYARSLMNFEQQIVTLQARSSNEADLPGYYEKLHEIYAHLDEPDGMEGMSTLILSPSLEHQIREHENTGRWTSAQSCWEVRLQESPDNVEFHLGLLRCLRNLGHYDTLRTHVTGVLTRNPEWERVLAGFQVESAWMVGAWGDVQRLVERIDSNTSSLVIARVFLAMRTGNKDSVTEALSQARSTLGAPITAAGVKGYRRSYEAVLDLHLLHELELIYEATCDLPPSSQEPAKQSRRRKMQELSQTLSSRLDVTLPTFRCREPLLSMRRTAFTLSKNSRLGLILKREIGTTWLASAKIARKAKQWQTAYSATLQAQQSKVSYSFIESAKLLKASGEPLRAVHELENSIKLLGLFDESVMDLTADADSERMKAKIQVLRARWMNECDRFDISVIFGIFQEATNLQKNWESAHYYLGQFHDECFKALSPSEQIKRGLKMNVYTVRSFSKAILYGSKFVYQTIPRMLTIWLDTGEDKATAGLDPFKKMTETMARAMKETPVFKWFIAFPQIVSRVAHDNGEVYKYIKQLIVTIMEAYPKQALWLFMSVVKSTKVNRSQRGTEILNQLRNNPHNHRNQVSKLVNESLAMTDQLLALCDYPVDENKVAMSMSKDFPKLKGMGRSDLIIPLQESLTASLPPTSSAESTHQPFPLDAPTFQEFTDEIEVMRSLAKPRKITIKGSNGQVYMFLGKPKDDLRKDARLMDLNSIINKLLKGNSESRRRQLHIRTYGVVALNEECGFIQWVPNTIPIRPVLHKYYDAQLIKGWSGEMADVFKRIKEGPEKDAAGLFQSRILSIFKPVFHEWFIETFPEPTAWLASRLTYGRTAAVMSMVGFILGLGDRHCENILLDTNSGDVVHVDFNCLFEKGKSLDTPERVPFRLTQNIIDGLGITGVEGVFRISCEVTMQLLRDNKDSLMSVLDAFVHDPLGEWEDEKRKLDREPRRHTSANAKAKVDMRALAKSSLNPIEKKLKGIYSLNSSRERHEREVSTSDLVQMLIQEATDLTNLAKMYPGWAPWH